MTTLAIFALQGALILIALWRSKADRIVLVLLTAWVIASVLGPLQSDVARQPALSTIDALVGVAMTLLWSAADDFRAWWVGLIAWVKVALRLSYVISPYMDHWYFAAILNCALLAQTVIAGGFTDAIGHRLDDMLRRFFPRRHSLLHNGM
jgi:hypothetical protein